jgi:NTP pyrophosphatase (non-canonical NTP hydrolase)
MENKEISFKDYQKQTFSTAVFRTKTLTLAKDNMMLFKLLNLSYLGLGLGEVGELQGKLKKVIRDGEGLVTPETKERLKGEIGDILWYVSELCTELGLEMEDVAMSNLVKLASRKERGLLQGEGDNR